MPRVTRAALIQCANPLADCSDLNKVKQAMIDKHLPLIKQAAEQGAQVLCLQEIFNGPYFCAEQQTRWYDTAEPIPDGPTVKLMQEQAKKYGMVMVVPIYEKAMTGVYYNSAAVIDRPARPIAYSSSTSTCVPEASAVARTKIARCGG